MKSEFLWSLVFHNSRAARKAAAQPERPLYIQLSCIFFYVELELALSLEVRADHSVC